MLLTLVVAIVGIAVVWLWWNYKDRYIGTDNRHRWFAEYFKGFPVFHNGKTLPMKKKLFEPLQSLAKSKTGLRILEIGAGSGANLQFYPKGTKLTVVDPNRHFKEILVQELEKHPNVTLDRYVVTGAEDMKGIDDKSVDAVVSTLVLCSCDHLQQSFKEIRRVLVPGGKYYFMEHVLDDTNFIIKILQILGSRSGLFQFLFDGCRADKDLETELRRGGFASVDANNFRLDLTGGVPLMLTSVYMIIPHLFGTATVN